MTERQRRGSDTPALFHPRAWNGSPVDLRLAALAYRKPTPVAEPISSLTIPIGAGALAGLSMLKGGA
jgi:hypothetical protein